MSFFGLFGPPNIEKLKTKGNVKELIKVLGYRKDPSVRQKAAEALGEIGDASAVEALIAALNDENEDVREAATIGLGSIGSPAVEPLIAAFKETNAGMRQTITKVLDLTNNPRAKELLAVTYWIQERQWDKCVEVGTPAVEPLITVLKSEDKDVRQAAAKALGEIGDVRAVEPLGMMLRNSNERRIAAPALRQIGDSQAIQMLIAGLKDEYAFSGTPIAEALGAIGMPAIELLQIALQDEDRHIRAGSARALGLIGGVQAIESLVTILLDKEDSVRSAGASSLDKLGWQPDTGEIGAAYWAIKKDWDRCMAIGTPAIQSLCFMLKYSNIKEVERSIIETLGKIGDSQAVEPIIGVLKDKERHDWVRYSAAEALGQIADPRAVEPLIEALREKDRRLNQAAATALGKIGDLRAIEPLTEALKKGDKFLQQDAVTALDQLTKTNQIDISQQKQINQSFMQKEVSRLISQLNTSRKGSRVAAARKLVTFYHSGELSDESKNLILKSRKTITQAHLDTSSTQHVDNTGAPACVGHYDYEQANHEDTGIGLDFPL